MYISPFWCGVIATLLVEVVAGIVLSLHDRWEDEKGGEDET